MKNNLNDMVEEILKDVAMRKSYGTNQSSERALKIVNAQIETQSEFKVPVNRLNKKERRGIEINDLVL